jgi:polyisoprenyl-phosphate glycosyltransferase
MCEKLVSIVVPMYFEELVAEECYTRLTKMAIENNLNYELIFVNDGSTDNTLSILEGIAKKDSHIRILSFSRNFGHQIAITAGMDKAKGDAVVVIDADLQDPPELIPQMIELWKQGYEVVYAQRKKREGETFFKLVTAKMFYRILNKLSSIKIPMDTGDFRLLDRKVVEALRKMPEKNRFVRGMVSWIGFKQTPIEYERKERFAGETKYPFKKMLKLALDGIVSFSMKPVKIVEYFGVFIITIAFMIFTFAILNTFLGIVDLTLGVGAFAAFVALIGGVQLLSIGVLGEYITRIYDESTDRPLYIIDKEIDFNIPLTAETPINFEEQLQQKVG